MRYAYMERVAADDPHVTYVGGSFPLTSAGVPTGWIGLLRARATGNTGSGAVYVVCASP